MANTHVLIGALTILVVWYAYKWLRSWRYEPYRDVPQPPSSLVFGHLKMIGEWTAKGNPDRHTDYVFDEIGQSLGRPPFYVLDLRPAMQPICVIMSHEIAEQISKPTSHFKYSTPKSPTLDDFIAVTGEWSIIRTQGEQWKALRRRFNAGFAPQHLNTLLPRILEKTKLLADRLDGFARSGEEFAFGDLCTSFTFDIIGAVTMDVDFGAQGPLSEQNPIVRDFRELIQQYGNAILAVNWLTAPLKMYRRGKYGMRVDAELAKHVRAQFAKNQENGEKANQDSGRSILSLSLKDVDELTPTVLQQTIDQLKSFLFAGHDTTSTLLQWTFYELSRNPRVLKLLRSELDEVLGPDTDPDSVIQRLMSRGDEALSKLAYTSAIIKEALRLFSPAGTARMTRIGSGFTLKTQNIREVCLDNVVLYNSHYSIHRDPGVYGETACDFLPDRWIGDINTSADEYSSTEKSDQIKEQANKVPPTAWRVFERGPRNCIGQELANIEARVVLACIARRFDFEKVGMGALTVKDGEYVLNEKGEYEVDVPLLNIRQITSKPMDNTIMKVKVH